MKNTIENEIQIRLNKMYFNLENVLNLEKSGNALLKSDKTRKFIKGQIDAMETLLKWVNTDEDNKKEDLLHNYPH